MSPHGKSSSVITLTTDFGSRDGYVAAMKGVILGIRPGTTLVDISHELPPQDIPHASIVLGTACRYFPRDTVHVAVVDPGVGTTRRPLLLATPGGRYVAPDNGLLSYLLMEYGVGRGTGMAEMPADSKFMEPITVPVPEGCSAYVLNRSEFWLQPLSHTFHGRDIFAPVAAHLADGVPPEDLGDPVGDVICLYTPTPVKRRDGLQGRIVYIDRFGNLVSNLRTADVGGESVHIEIAGRHIQGLSRSYAGGQGLLAIIGSNGYLEVSLREGSAAERLRVQVGSEITVRSEAGVTPL